MHRVQIRKFSSHDEKLEKSQKPQKIYSIYDGIF